MTKLTVNPGPCGFLTGVSAEMNEDEEVVVKVASGCAAVQQMMASLGDTFDPYEVCLVKPGKGPLFAYAAEKFPVHAGCPVLCGITKCIEAEAGLALKHDVSIKFEDE